MIPHAVRGRGAGCARRTGFRRDRTPRNHENAPTCDFLFEGRVSRWIATERGRGRANRTPPTRKFLIFARVSRTFPACRIEHMSHSGGERDEPPGTGRPGDRRSGRGRRPVVTEGADATAGSREHVRTPKPL